VDDVDLNVGLLVCVDVGAVEQMIHGGTVAEPM
jgi:hypothetical protein